MCRQEGRSLFCYTGGLKHHTVCLHHTVYYIYTSSKNEYVLPSEVWNTGWIQEMQDQTEQLRKSFHLNQLSQFNRDQMILHLHLNCPHACVNKYPSEWISGTILHFSKEEIFSKSYTFFLSAAPTVEPGCLSTVLPPGFRWDWNSSWTLMNYSSAHIMWANYFI